MEKSHQAESNREEKSKKSPGGASQSHNQSDVNPNDLSGQGLKLNTSLDRSGGNLAGTRMDGTGQPGGQRPNANLSGLHILSDVSRLGSAAAQANFQSQA